MVHQTLRIALFVIVVTLTVQAHERGSRALGQSNRDSSAQLFDSLSAEEKERFRSLVEILNKGDTVQRCQAIQELSSEPYQLHAQSELRHRLVHDKEELVRRTAAQAFLRTGYRHEYELQDLELAMRDSSPAVRLRAAIVMGDVVSSISDEVSYDGKEGDTEKLAYFRSVKTRLDDDRDPVIRGLMQLGWLASLYQDEPRGPDLKHIVPLVFAAIEQENKTPIPVPRDEELTLGEFGYLSLFGVIGPAAESAVPRLMNELESLDKFPTGIAHQGDANTDKCQTVMAALIGIGKPAVPDLQKALRSPREAVRRTAALALAFIDPMSNEPVPILLESLQSDCWGVCFTAAFRRVDVDALETIGPRVIPALFNEVRMKPAIKKFALSIVSSLYQQPSTVPILIKALQDRDANIRSISAAGLGYQGVQARAARDGLKSLLNDESEEVRQASRDAIDRINAALEQERE